MISERLHLCIITPDYPGKKGSNYIFVKQLVEEFGYSNIDCSVVAPFSIAKSLIRALPFENKYDIKHQKCGSKIEVFRPRYISFSNLRLFRISLTDYLLKAIIRRALNKLKRKPDIIYCHFWRSGIYSYDFAKKNNIPLYVASGESIIPETNIGQQFNLDEFRDYVSGVICVSNKNKNESIARGFTYEQKCIVLPNGVNLSKFYKKDKRISRKALGYSINDFIVAFVGSFDENKGSRRVSSAIMSLNENIKSIFIGSGHFEPDCYGVLFCGKLRHDEINNYLNCADVFVLPSLSEGCSNAIIEAMACGLPIIAANLQFSWDILNSSNSILINPNSIKEIAHAMKKLKDDVVLRRKLSKGAIRTAKTLSLSERAQNIIRFITQIS